MTDPSPPRKASRDLRRVKKGSRLLPILTLVAVVVGFLAYGTAVPSPQLELQTVASPTAIRPARGNRINLTIIARVPGPGGTLHFRDFGPTGKELFEHLTETDIVNSARAEERERVRQEIERFKSRLAPEWNRNDHDRSQQERMEVLVWAWRIMGTTDARRPLLNSFLFWGEYLQNRASALATDVPRILRTELTAIVVLALYALIPGVLGMTYRRSFWTWFVMAFLGLFAIAWLFDAIGYESVLAVRNPTEAWTPGFVRLGEEMAVLLLIVFRVRRESAAAIGQAEQRKAQSLALVLMLSVVAGVYVVFRAGWLFDAHSGWHVVQASALLLALACVLLTQVRVQPRAAHGKYLVVCVDGTWFFPGAQDYDRVAVTNVYKLFSMCKGEAASGYHNANQCKAYEDRQTAFYYEGVGNEVDYSPLGQVFGGSSGLGAAAIVERAYLDVVKAYRPGDRICLFGFSRGAAIARLLADALGSRGVPMSLWTLRLFGRHFMLSKSANALDVTIELLGCWDTVASFGIPKKILGIDFQRIHLLKDFTVPTHVKRAYHMLALDETRDSFEPTLMDPDPTAPHRIVEVWFSGSHSDVGGGFATDNLSDVALDFLLRQVSSGYAWKPEQTVGDETWGLYLNAAVKGHAAGTASGGPYEVDPNPLGPIRTSSGALYSFAPRRLPMHAVIADCVFDRMSRSVPVYAPQSLFDLNQNFATKREDIHAEVKRLLETQSVDADECTRILQWTDTHLSLTRWSQFLNLTVGGTVSMRQALDLQADLRNPPTAGRA